MKIQGCNPDNFIIKNVVQKREKGQFKEVITNATTKNELENTQVQEQAPRLKCGVSVNMPFLAVGSDNTANYKNLLADSIQLETDILQHIQSICSDDTGKEIDMNALDELLDIYIEAMEGEWGHESKD